MRKFNPSSNFRNSRNFRCGDGYLQNRAGRMPGNQREGVRPRIRNGAGSLSPCLDRMPQEEERQMRDPREKHLTIFPVPAPGYGPGLGVLYGVTVCIFLTIPILLHDEGCLFRHQNRSRSIRCARARV